MSSDPSKSTPERPLQNADAQAEVFAVVRQAHQMESTEDYVELIDDLIVSQGEARLVEVAERLGISQPSASKTLARLQREGFVTSEPYRSIFLTDKGKQLADASRARHDVVYQFLLSIGVSEATAKVDSEGVEHHVSEETLRAFQRIIDSQAALGKT
ncbi:MAG: manganese-binding transcriptional regulator MntR [Granulosicoccus sp.]